MSDAAWPAAAGCRVHVEGWKEDGAPRRRVFLPAWVPTPAAAPLVSAGARTAPSWRCGTSSTRTFRECRCGHAGGGGSLLGRARRGSAVLPVGGSRGRPAAPSSRRRQRRSVARGTADSRFAHHAPPPACPALIPQLHPRVHHHRQRHAILPDGSPNLCLPSHPSCLPACSSAPESIKATQARRPPIQLSCEPSSPACHPPISSTPSPSSPTTACASSRTGWTALGPSRQATVCLDQPGPARP